MIDGTMNLNRHLEQMSRADIEAGIRKGILLVQGSAKMNVPAVSGSLRESILIDVETDGDIVRGICYSNLKYAPFVEFGTGPRGQAEHAGISPDASLVYTQSPWWIHEGAGENEVDRATAERYGWPYIDTKQGRFYRCSGQPANPYMYPALKDNEKAIVKLIREEFQTQP